MIYLVSYVSKNISIHAFKIRLLVNTSVPTVISTSTLLCRQALLNMIWQWKKSFVKITKYRDKWLFKQYAQCVLKYITTLFAYKCIDCQMHV